MKLFTRAAILLAVVLACVACANNPTSSSSTTTSQPPVAKPLLTMYSVGDIDHFDDRLATLAKSIVKDDPTGTWWLLGDAGYGTRSDVTKNYKEIAAVIPRSQTHMIFGDHDYGTQEPTQFTLDNLDATGAHDILGAKDQFDYTIDKAGTLKELKQSESKFARNIEWTIEGINDICVETGTIRNVDCYPSRFETYKKTLESNNALSRCSIAMWHHPTFGVLKNGGSDQVGSEQYGVPLFTNAIDNGVDIILNGDHHHFLSTKNIDKSGHLVAKNSKTPFTREFIVGTGGAPASSNNNTPKLKTNAIDSDIQGKIGVLKLELYHDRAHVSFITTDSVLYTTDINCS